MEELRNEVIQEEEINEETIDNELVEVEDDLEELVDIEEDDDETEEVDSKIGLVLLAGAGVAAGYGAYRFGKDIAIPGIKKAGHWIGSKIPFQLKKKPKVDVVDNETGEKVADLNGGDYEEEDFFDDEPEGKAEETIEQTEKVKG